MINFLIDEKETVVGFVESLYLNGRVLCIVTVNVQLELLADMLGVNGGLHGAFPFVKQGQYRIVHIIVDEND